MKYKKKRVQHLIIVFIFFSLIFQIYNVIPINNLIGANNQGKIYLSTELPGKKQWLENPNFTSPIDTTWYSSKEGDKSDIYASTSGEHANFWVLGEQITFSNISGIPKNASYDDGWLNSTNRFLSALPDEVKINNTGCHAFHHWPDGSNADQTPSIHWCRNITIPVDMSEYKITSANLTVIVNATVDRNIDTPNDDESRYNPDRPLNQHANYDNVKFYALISDLEKKFPNEVASLQTVYLGQHDPDGIYEDILNLTDTQLINVPEKSLIDILTYVFERNHYNFTITLGIDIFCEDNYNWDDRDTWNDLCIKSCNLTFTYEKKINQLTSISWNQDGDKISDLSPNRVMVSNATLNFTYKISQPWPELLSPNSEIKVFINNKEHAETIKLSSVSTSFKKASFNVTSLISDDVNLSLQVFLADDFGLNRTIIILIDEVSLDISYVIIIPDEPGVDWTLLIIILIASIAGLVITFSLYQTHFKYPPIVRKMRKLRKKIKKGKTAKQILLKKRQELIENGSKEQTKILNFDNIIPEKTGKVEKIKGINKSEK